ncbi:MAG: hypothetical protein WC526_01095 [Patescibacteria group bacterium]
MHGKTGLVSVRKGDEVVFKFWTDCGGENAADVAEAIRKEGRVPKIKEALVLATVTGFGCDGCQLLIAKCENVAEVTIDEPFAAAALKDAKSSPYASHERADYYEEVVL